MKNLRCGLPVLVLLGLLLVVNQAFSKTSLFNASVDYAITADVLWLFDKDFQLELANTLTHRLVWTLRLGYTTHREGKGGTGEKYGEDKGRWYLGFRWRGYYIARAPHLAFISLGLDNRPQDNLITPLADVGATLNIKPLTITALYSLGYEIYVRSHKAEGFENRWVHGPEVRVGVCF